jgi:ketosteroid isomerase-like protein
MKREAKMLLRRTAMFTLSVGLLAPASVGLLAPAMAAAATRDEQVRTAYAAWDAVFGKSDAKAIGAFYTDDAFFLPPTHDIIRGPAGVEKFFAGLFTAGVTGHKLELIEANGTPELIVAAAKWSARSKDGPIGGVATHEFSRQANGGLKLRLHTFN